MASSEESTRTEWVTTQFRDSLQALAMPADTQLELFPARANVCSELLVDVISFGEAYINVESSKLSAERVDEICSVIDATRNFYEIAVKHSWDHRRLFSGKEWERARVLAIGLLRSIGWAVERPAPR